MSEWLYAFHGEEGEKFMSDDKSGKWLLFFSRDIGEWWEKIATATEQGELGPQAKISTVPRKGRRVICVYARDEGHAMEVRATLQRMGVTWSVPFKFCWMTAAGMKGSAFSA